MDIVIFRTISLILVVALYNFLDSLTMLAVVFCASMSHNTLALYYERYKIKSLFARWRETKYFILVILALMVISYFNIVTAVFFGLGIHIIATEIYISRNSLHRGWAMVPRVLLHFAVYFLLIRGEAPQIGIYLDDWVWRAAFLVSLSVYFVFNLFRWKSITKLEALLDSTVIIAGIGGLFAGVEFAEIVVYHVLFWFFYPIKMLKRQNQHIFYFTATAALAFGAAMVSPLLPVSKYVLEGEQLKLFVFYYGTFHFICSLLLTNTIPDWLKQRVFPVGSLPMAIKLEKES